MKRLFLFVLSLMLLSCAAKNINNQNIPNQAIILEKTSEIEEKYKNVKAICGDYKNKLLIVYFIKYDNNKLLIDNQNFDNLQNNILLLENCLDQYNSIDKNK